MAGKIGQGLAEYAMEDNDMEFVAGGYQQVIGEGEGVKIMVCMNRCSNCGETKTGLFYIDTETGFVSCQDCMDAI
ncbi:MAG: hypothetical protein II800_05920 [Lachnospiraceae bacterium]|nr:hypothetical protein [Lachnospiraceae bacterium]